MNPKLIGIMKRIQDVKKSIRVRFNIRKVPDCDHTFCPGESFLTTGQCSGNGCIFDFVKDIDKLPNCDKCNNKYLKNLGCICSYD